MDAARGAQCRLAAFVLTIFALVVAATGFICLGLATHPPTSSLGLGVVPMLVGTHFMFYAIGLLATSGLLTVASLVYYHSLPLEKEGTRSDKTLQG